MNSEAMLQAVIFGINQDGDNYIELLPKTDSGYKKRRDDYGKQPIESTAYQVQNTVRAAVNAWLNP
ncbi:MAG: hypothetical protein IPP74_08555 [Alphaproteobacteria bacterium]|nr:hypothetical protein [Alphaproteobacteria bacterium]